MINKDVWTSLTARQATLPHALLFAGPEGIGKRELADALAARLLCEVPRQAHEAACGECVSCHMFANGTHPDFRLVQPEAAEEEEGGVIDGERKKASKQIRIQQIRELEEFFHVGGHRGGRRVCIIDPAETMNAVTANSLLKILEEPSVSFYFIMISHRWRKLLPTLLSRSRRVMFAPVPDPQATEWLAGQNLDNQARWLPFFGHAPLAVATAATSGRLKAIETMLNDLANPGDPLTIAARWETLVKSDAALGMEDLVITLQKWLHDLALCAVLQTPRFLPHQAKTMTNLARRVNLPGLVQAQRQLTQMRGLANHPLNARLFLEDLCMRAFRPFQSAAVASR